MQAISQAYRRATRGRCITRRLIKLLKMGRLWPEAEVDLTVGFGGISAAPPSQG